MAHALLPITYYLLGTAVYKEKSYNEKLHKEKS